MTAKGPGGTSPAAAEDTDGEVALTTAPRDGGPEGGPAGPRTDLLLAALRRSGERGRGNLTAAPLVPSRCQLHRISIVYPDGAGQPVRLHHQSGRSGGVSTRPPSTCTMAPVTHLECVPAASCTTHQATSSVSPIRPRGTALPSAAMVAARSVPGRW